MKRKYILFAMFVILVIITMIIDFAPNYIITEYDLWHATDDVYMKRVWYKSNTIWNLCFIPTHLAISIISLKWIFKRDIKKITKVVLSTIFILLMLGYLLLVAAITILPHVLR